MSPTRAPLRIEIVDPANDLPGEGWTRHAAVATAPTGFDEWLGSLTDAGGAAVGHLGPLTRGLSRSVARGRRVWRAAHDRSWQRRTDGNPRRGSAVRQHVFAPFDVVAGHLGSLSGEALRLPGGSLVFSSGFVALPGGGRRSDAALGLVGSWPRLPVVVRVEPWWRDQTIVTVELRTRRRLRYPRRYFTGAHRAAREVARTLAGRAAPSSP